MPQIRLTKKCVKKLKIKDPSEPASTMSPFDDWAINLIFIYRKKVAMITHVKSALTFILPCKQAGGIKGVIANIAVLLIRWLNENSLTEFIPQVKELFAQPFVFCKVQDRRILGIMNDFKRCVGCYRYSNYEDINWDYLSNITNDIPIDVVKIWECKSPKGEFFKILNRPQPQVKQVLSSGLVGFVKTPENRKIPRLYLSEDFLKKQ